ncbi:MAG: ABC transporter permease [Flavobacteriales bacterium]|nr:ABC transporter permease [Flavobacteriales bacterium]
MDVSFFIARRHLFAKKSRGIINLISTISMLVVAFITAAMICVLSAFNGIDELVKDLFANFDTPLTIIPSEGKSFPDSLMTDQAILSIGGVKGVSRVIEEDAWLTYKDHNAVSTVKGVDQNYLALSPIDTMVYDGQFLLEDESFFYAVVGLGVRSELYMPLYDYAPTVMNINAPIRGRKLSRYKENAFNREAINVSGIFSVNAELDAKYVIVPLAFARKLFEMENDISSIEIFLDDEKNADEIKQKLQSILPAGLRIETRYEKNALVYKTNASEKWATFLILLFILLIACFNIIASLTMLIIEKKKDIFTLNSMGIDASGVERIFVYEGVFINLIGALLGLILGLALCFVQMKFGLIGLEGAMVDAYPVSVHGVDVVGILLTVVLVGSVFSATLVRLLVRRFASNAMMKVD